MQSIPKSVTRKAVLVVDGLMVILAMVSALLLHPLLRDFIPRIKQITRIEEYSALVYLTVPVWLMLIAMLGLNRVLERKWTRTELLVELVKLQSLGLLVLTAILFLTQGIINRSLVALFLLVSFFLLYAERAVMQFWLRYQHERGHGRVRLLVIGDPGPELDGFVKVVCRETLPPLLIGRLGNPSSENGDPPFRGSPAELERLLREEPVDQVLFFPPFNHPDRVKETLGICETLGIKAGFSIDLVKPLQAPPRFSRLYDFPFMEFEVAPRRPESLAVKHALDFVLALIGLVLLVPVFVLVSLAILVFMGRPVLFSQERAGLFGRKFRMLKFRTMVPDAEVQRDRVERFNQMDGPVFKSSRDPRITRLGRFLRRWSLDELPQLVNVLSGTMSLVGPRPLPVVEQQQINGWQRRRLSMKPGITGLWQVSGRNLVGFEEWMKLDLVYVDEWSLRLDVRILLKTAWVVLTGRGAR